VIISRYLFKEIFYTLLALTLLLILVYISHRFMLYLVRAAAGTLPIKFIFELLGVKLLCDLTVILPLALFLTILLVLGRLYKDNEITAFAACGVPVPFTGIIIFSLLFAILIGFLSFFLAPWAENQMTVLKTELNTETELSGIAAGRFKGFSNSDAVFYVEYVNKNNQMDTVFIQYNRNNQHIILSAQNAYQTAYNNDSYMVLVNGQRYESPTRSLRYTVTHFAEHHIKVPKRLDDSFSSTKRDTLPTGLLIGATDPSYQAELQWRISLPLSAILLALLAIPLSHTTPRKGQYSSIFLGILVYLIYNNSLNIAQKWIERGTIPHWIGVWWVHVSLILITLLLFQLPTLRHKYAQFKQ
jgi:lipopolysaccharide export system permease protein